MATIQGYNFIFNDDNNESYGVIMCRFDDSSYSSNDEEANIITSKTFGSDVFHLVNVDYENPLKFTITICKEDGTYFNTDEQSRIKKWLCRKDDYHWLYIDQEDMYDIRYKAIMTFAGMKDIGGKNGGMTFNVQCNSPFPYSSEYSVKKICTSETLLFDLYCDSDFAESDSVIYPNVTITSATTGTIQIKNETTGETMKFTDCSVGEVITITENEIPSTSANRVILDHWNYTSLYFIDGDNKIIITGNCTLQLTYSLPRRVGG